MDIIRNINGVELKIRTFDGKRILTTSDLNSIFNANKRYMYRLRDFKKKKDFKESVDYYRVPPEVFRIYSKTQTVAHGFLITESGYKKIVYGGEDKYVIQWVDDCYYNDKPKPVKPEPKKLVTKPKKIDAQSKEIITETKVSNDDLRDVMIEYIKFQTKILDEQRKMYSEFITELKEILKPEAKVPLIIKEKIIKGNSKDYEVFKKEIRDLANAVLVKNNKYKSTNDVLSAAYKSLRDRYGIVWEQEEKEFYEEVGRKPESTIELQWWIEHKPYYQDLLKNRLIDMKEH